MPLSGANHDVTLNVEQTLSWEHQTNYKRKKLIWWRHAVIHDSLEDFERVHYSGYPASKWYLVSFKWLLLITVLVYLYVINVFVRY